MLRQSIKFAVLALTSTSLLASVTGATPGADFWVKNLRWSKTLDLATPQDPPPNSLVIDNVVVAESDVKSDYYIVTVQSQLSGLDIPTERGWMVTGEGFSTTDTNGERYRGSQIVGTYISVWTYNDPDYDDREGRAKILTEVKVRGKVKWENTECGAFVKGFAQVSGDLVEGTKEALLTQAAFETAPELLPDLHVNGINGPSPVSVKLTGLGASDGTVSDLDKDQDFQEQCVTSFKTKFRCRADVYFSSQNGIPAAPARSSGWMKAISKYSLSLDDCPDYEFDVDCSTGYYNGQDAAHPVAYATGLEDAQSGLDFGAGYDDSGAWDDAECGYFEGYLETYSCAYEAGYGDGSDDGEGSSSGDGEGEGDGEGDGVEECSAGYNLGAFEAFMAGYEAGSSDRLNGADYGCSYDESGAEANSDCGYSDGYRDAYGSAYEAGYWG